MMQYDVFGANEWKRCNALKTIKYSYIHDKGHAWIAQTSLAYIKIYIGKDYAKSFLLEVEFVDIYSSRVCINRCLSSVVSLKGYFFLWLSLQWISLYVLAVSTPLCIYTKSAAEV